MATNCRWDDASLLGCGAFGYDRSLTLRCAKWESQGRTVVLVSRDGLVVGALAVSDKVRSTALAAVRDLNALGLHCVLVTGDHEAAARTVATSIGVDDVISAALPADKVAAIRQLQQEGHRVAMVEMASTMALPWRAPTSASLWAQAPMSPWNRPT